MNKLISFRLTPEIEDYIFDQSQPDETAGQTAKRLLTWLAREDINPSSITINEVHQEIALFHNGLQTVNKNVLAIAEILEESHPPQKTKPKGFG